MFYTFSSQNSRTFDISITRLLALTVAKLSTIKNSSFLRTTAVPAGTAERILAMVILSVCPSVCLSVRHNPVPNQAQVI